jgi:hypothetical protein
MDDLWLTLLWRGVIVLEANRLHRLLIIVRVFPVHLLYRGVDSIWEWPPLQYLHTAFVLAGHDARGGLLAVEH